MSKFKQALDRYLYEFGAMPKIKAKSKNRLIYTIKFYQCKPSTMVSVWGMK